MLILAALAMLVTTNHCLFCYVNWLFIFQVIHYCIFKLTLNDVLFITS